MTEFSTYPEPEQFDPKAEREKIRADEREAAKAAWDISDARWSRFVVTVIAVVVSAILCAFLWWVVSAIYNNHVWNSARTAWVTQCRIEGGVPVRDIDLKDGPILCVMNGKVIRTF